MKQKTHRGTKKRVKVRKSGNVVVQKAAKNHRLVSKSKRQKKLAMDGYEVSPSRLQSIRRLMPGKVAPQGTRRVKREEKAAERAA